MWRGIIDSRYLEEEERGSSVDCLLASSISFRCRSLRVHGIALQGDQ